MTTLVTNQGISTGPLLPVVVFHDERGWFEKDDDPAGAVLRQVYSCQASAESEVRNVLEEVFFAFNEGNPNDYPAVKEYRDARLRSLSVGDVVQVGESAWRCDRFGWSRFSGIR